MYRDIMLHFIPRTVVRWSRDNRLRIYHPGKASAGRLARTLSNLSGLGMLEHMPPSSCYLGAWYRVWDV